MLVHNLTQNSEWEQQLKKTLEDQPLKDIELNRRRYGIIDWLTMSQDDVINRFASLKGAKKVGEGNQQFVYVPGTRKDRVLLVAHADTVWRYKSGKYAPISVGFCKGNYFSLQKDIGIGADDRAGCCMLWHVRNSGHSLLILCGEECGAVASNFLMKHDEWKTEINNHQFAIEADRMNSGDLAFYDVGSIEFKDWFEKQFTKYTRTYGLFTDICVLCKSICGVNISIGYYGQHTPNERLNEAEWENSLNLLKKLLSSKDLPKFERKPEVVHNWRDDYDDDSWRNSYRGNYQTAQKIVSSAATTAVATITKKLNDDIFNLIDTDEILLCPKCKSIFDKNEFKQNGEKCIFCGESF